MKVIALLITTLHKVVICFSLDSVLTDLSFEARSYPCKAPNNIALSVRL